MSVLWSLVDTPWGSVPLVFVIVVMIAGVCLLWRIISWPARMVRWVQRARLLPARLVAVARLRANPRALSDDCNLVGIHRGWYGHRISWPREWCSPQDANLRGGRLMNELWPGELPLPVEAHGSWWVMRSRRVD